uniref:Uncharacterized protein n=1 Tax=Anopheles culicifacies TaxID=139723 RepID=A0A182LSH3_9DIPT
MTDVTIPINVPIPSRNSMKKNSTEKNWGRKLNLAIVSGYVMNVRAGPLWTTFEISGWPILFEKSLNDEYTINPPKQMVSEKKHCVTASYHTSIVNSLSHCGSKKYLIPVHAPSSHDTSNVIKRHCKQTPSSVASNKDKAIVPVIVFPRDENLPTYRKYKSADVRGWVTFAPSVTLPSRLESTQSTQSGSHVLQGSSGLKEATIYRSVTASTEA